MKKLILLTLILISVNCFAQSEDLSIRGWMLHFEKIDSLKNEIKRIEREIKALIRDESQRIETVSPKKLDSEYVEYQKKGGNERLKVSGINPEEHVRIVETDSNMVIYPIEDEKDYFIIQNDNGDYRTQEVVLKDDIVGLQQRTTNHGQIFTYYLKTKYYLIEIWESNYNKIYNWFLNERPKTKN